MRLVVQKVRELRALRGGQLRPIIRVVMRLADDAERPMRDPKRRGARAKKGDLIGIETFDGDWPLVMRQRLRRALRDGGVAIEGALDLYNDRRSSADRGEKLGKPRNGVTGAAQPQTTEFIRAVLRDSPGAFGQALQRLVVKYDEFAVGCELHVAFDAKARGDRRAGGRNRIFDHALAGVMQSAVRDRPRRQP